MKTIDNRTGRRWLTSVSTLALFALANPAVAQSVAITGDVSPSTATSPVWNLGGSLFIGSFGTGTLTVADGGTVTNSVGIIGSAPGSDGTVTVAGAGSTWSNSGFLDVGSSGIGTLTVEAGGTVVSNGVGTFGRAGGSEGTVVVTGAGSIWTNNGSLEIGSAGTGTLTVADSGTMSNGNGFVGRFIGSEGTVVVTGAGSTWSNNGDLYVGSTGTGTLTVEAGGTVSNGFGAIGTNAGSEGSVTVTGAGSTWISNSQLYVGGLGTGTLTVEDGGAVISANADIQTGDGGTAAVTVTGDGSTWINSGFLRIGDSGIGTLTIADGGRVENTSGIIGHLSGDGYRSVGTVTVTGDGSTWVNNDLFAVGVWGTGTLTIADGGTVDNTDSFIGFGEGGSGAVTVTGSGSTWVNSGSLHVGGNDQAAGGTGTLTVEDGGRVGNTFGYIGFGGGSEGMVTVSGAASAWTNSITLAVGFEGTGTLIVEDGGTVSNEIGVIGLSADAKGTVTVTGTGSTWTNSSTLAVGSSGAGTLIVSDGGTVENRFGYIGFDGGSEGTVTVTGAGSTWTNSGGLDVGVSSTGTLTVEAGGTVANMGGIIGRFIGSEGKATVTGAGSTLASNGALFVGDLGTGTLSVADGGAVSATQIAIAQASGSTGTLNIGAGAGETAIAAGTLDTAEIRFGAGAGTLNFNHTDANYAFAPSISGAGTINHIVGTTTLTGDSSGFAGSTSVSGGVLRVDGSFGDGVSTVGVSGSGGLGGSGVIGGAVTVGDGTLIGVQGQTLAVGSLALGAGSIVDVTLGGAPTAALFDVAGALALNGTLNVTDQGGFGIGVYRLFDYAGALTGDGLTIGATPAGFVADDLAIQSSVANQINLVSLVGAELGFWDGGDPALRDNDAIDGGSGIWRADGRNWTDMDGVLNGSYRPNPTFAVFQGQAGIVTVDDSAGDIGVTGMQFVTDGYRIEGDAITLEGAGGASIIRVGDGTVAGAGITATIASELTGTSTLVKSDLGTLVLSGANSYTGGTELRSGTLSVSEDSSLGISAGGLLFTGGTLATAASFNMNRAVSLDATGRFDVASGTTLGLSGNIAGTGGLDLTGGGTLILTGANTYDGNTIVSSGALVGDTASIRNNIGNAGTMVFDQAADARFAGNIAGTGGANGQMIKQGEGILTLTGTSLLDWTVEDGGLVSAADRFGGDLAIETGGAFTFDQDFGGSYAGALSGTGTLGFTGGGAVALTGDSSGFAGLTEVVGATLIVNDALGGSALIGNGGRLAGTGTLGSGAGSTVTLASGATLAPGNSIGTLTVDGDLRIASGSRFEVEVMPGGTGSDLVSVTGVATIEGGTLAHIGMTGTYDPTQIYTILWAAGGLAADSEFEDVTSDFAFLDASLSYGSNTIDLTLTRNDTGFGTIGETRNQIATAIGVDGLGFGNDLYDAVVQLDATTALIAFDQLSGDIHASVTTGLIEDSRHIRNAANDRIRAAFEGVGASVTPVLAYGPDGPMLAPASSDLGPAVWGTAFGSWGATDGDGNAASLDRNTGGLIVGADGMLGDWRVGLLAGYSQSSFGVDDRASSASSDNYHLGLYGGTEWGALALRTGLAYTWSDIETNRAVGFTGFSDQLSADYNAGTVQAFGELGYAIETDFARFEPFVNLAHVSVRTNGFTESGGAAALTSSGSNTDTTFTTLGMRVETGLVLGDMTANLHGMVGWRHAFGDTPPTSTHAFAGSDAFTIAGSPIAQDAAVIEAGLDLNLTPDATFGLSYQGQFGRGAQDHGFKANLAVKF